MSRRRRKIIAVTRVCVSVCLSLRDRTPTLLHGAGCNLGAWQRLPPSCALLGGFAIGARVALLWQHNANPSYKLASIPRYDDIVRTAGWAGSARVADRRATGGGAPQTAHRIREAGAAGPPATGRRRGRSRHYCGSLECGFPLVAFWQQKANAKC